MEGRMIKQIMFLGITLIIIGSIGFFTYRAFNPHVEPTPTPIPFKPIEVQLVKALNVKDLDYDIIFKIKNPNDNYGSSNVSYSLIFQDESGEPFHTLGGSTYILPDQTKYVVTTNVKLPQALSDVKLNIVSVRWQRLQGFLPQNISFEITKNELLFKKVPGAFLDLAGIIFNVSDFDFGKVEIIGILKDKDGEMLAIGKTDVRTLVVNEKRAFEIKWSDDFPGWVDSMEIESYTDVFNNINFIQKYGTQEKFQQFY